MQTNIFQTLQKIQNLLFTDKSAFCGYTAIITHFFYNFKMELTFIKLHNHIMINRAEHFNSIQIFPLLQLAPVASPPPPPPLTLPYSKNWSLTRPLHLVVCKKFHSNFETFSVILWMLKCFKTQNCLRSKMSDFKVI